MQLARQVVGWRRRIALGWLIVAVTCLPRASRIAEVLDVGAKIAGSESAAVEQILAGPLASSFARVAVLVIGGVPVADSPYGVSALQRVVVEVTRAPEVVGTISYLNFGDSLFVAPSGNGSFVMVGLAPGPLTSERMVLQLRERTAVLARTLQREFPGLTLRWTGEAALNIDLRRASGDDVVRSERTALPLVAALLLFAFGTVAAAALPIVAGALAIGMALGVSALIAQFWSLSLILQSVVTMLGLGLGVDYALLMVSRFREGLAAGASSEIAAESAARHAGHTIVLSATTVALGFAVLLTVPLNEVRGIAVGGILVVVCSALLATTLLPGVLAWLGQRVNWGRIRRQRREAGSALLWRKLGLGVTARPWVALVVGAGPLLLLAAQSVRLRTGLPRGDWLPPTMESSQALKDLDAMGRGGIVQRIRMVLELPPGETIRRSGGWAALEGVVGAVERDARVERVHSMIGVAASMRMGSLGLAFLPDSLTRGLASADGRQALIEIVPRASVAPEELVTYVGELRRTATAHSGIVGARVAVGGLPGFNADYHDAVAGRFTGIVLLVTGGTFLALVVGLRSIVVPLKAVALNVLSVAAAFGALTLVFQEGVGGSLIGIDEPLGAVFSSLPLIVFCIVFGLSMDYEIFLMTRVMEARRRGMNERDAIVEALGTTGPVITNAALIMLAVFAAFAFADFLMLKMLGFALAVAVLVDATIVRIVVGPALLQLAGRWNWWPGSMGDSVRYPRVIVGRDS